MRGVQGGAGAGHPLLLPRLRRHPAAPGAGPSAKGALVPLSVNAIKVLRFFQREPPDAVDALEVPPHVLRETARALQSYTTYVLERDLKSARFMNLVASEAPRREPTAI